MIWADMRTLLIAIFTLSSFVGAWSQTGRPTDAVAKAFSGLVSFANYEALKLNVTRAITDKKVEHFKLLNKFVGAGIIFDVPVYEFNGANWTNGPIKLGIGASPLKAAMPNLRYVHEHGAMSSRPPAEYQYSAEKSYMVWVTLEDNKLQVNMMSSAHRQLFYQRVDEELAKAK